MLHYHVHKLVLLLCEGVEGRKKVNEMREMDGGIGRGLTISGYTNRKTSPIPEQNKEGLGTVLWILDYLQCRHSNEHV